MNKSKIPRPEKETGYYRVAFRCNEKEIQWLMREAKRYGLTKTAFAKRKTFNAPLSMVPKFKNIEL